MTRLKIVLTLMACLVWSVSSAAAQARDAKLVVTVNDQTGAVLPGAKVSLTGIEDATRALTLKPMMATDRGLATIDNLAPGRYSLRVEFDGFESAFVPDVRLRSGETKRTVTLGLKKLDQEVTVQRDKQTSAADPRSLTFGSTLTREQIEALSDDKDEMERQLREMAGGDAVFRVDSFEGGRLPDKSQIKAIHISRDQFAAENHSAGGISIDIVTQAGAGPWRMNSNYSLRDSALDGRNPLVARKGPTRNQNLGIGGGGTLIKNKLSTSFNIGERHSYSTPLMYYRASNGELISEVADIRTPSMGREIYADMTYALTKDQTLRVFYSQSDNTQRNGGVGGYDGLERAFNTKNRDHSIRGQEAGPLGRRFVTNTKFMVNWNESSTTSTSDALTIRINDASTLGGAQRRGGRTSTNFMVQSDLDYVKGMHTVRIGALLNGSSIRSDDSSNYTGTYVFESLAAFNAGRARSYSKRVGDPLVTYSSVQAGVYLQDDIRVRKNLSFSPGIRYEVQSHLRDYAAISPRFGVTWAPFKSGKTSLRASAGIFHDWLSSNVYEQSLRIDGFRQQELTILNPAYPNPGLSGNLSVSNRYLLDPELEMSRSVRFSGGLDQTISPQVRFNATYAYSRVAGILYGENLNAPVNGVRPMPQFANVIRVLSDGASRNHSLNTNLSLSFAAPSQALQQARFNVRRGSISVNYSIGRSLNNTDGAFSPPSSGDIANEWGPSGGDIRHRLNVFLNSQALKNLNVSLSAGASSGSPYNITTGVDDNRDQIFNDRPAGVGRNSARGDGQWNANLNISYSIGFGRRGGGTTAGGSGAGISGPIMISGGMAGAMEGMRVAVMNGAAGGPSAAPKYRLGINLSIQNPTNHANRFGYIGNMSSLDFGRATQVQGVRSVNLAVNFGF